LLDRLAKSWSVTARQPLLKSAQKRDLQAARLNYAAAKAGVGAALMTISD
jgi:hypothetical protein